MEDKFEREDMETTGQKGTGRPEDGYISEESLWQEMGLQQVEEPQPEENFPKKDSGKKPGFGLGILIGVLSTFAVSVILLVVITGFLISSVKDSSENENQIVSGQYSDNTGDGTVVSDESIINSDLLTQISMINAYLKQYYLYDIDMEEVRNGILQGLVSALGDPYSEYFNTSELSSFTDSTSGEYVGIGAAVTQELATGIVRISKPYEGTPSAEAGLLPGDVIVSVGDTEVTGMDLNQVVSLIKGEEGTSVVLHIYRESEEKYLDIEVTRKKVELPTVTSEMLDGNIGYIEVTGFEGVTADQFVSTYEALKKQGMKGVIVDLRNNGGGLVDTVEEMLDYLLPEGTIFYVKDKSGTKSMEYVSDAKAALDIPMVVLVNQYTASASEVFAGNIQEFGMGTVVGTTTYGKGVMQQLFYTNSKQTAAVKLTVADYYIHSDKNVNGTGIIPDVEVELDEEAAKMVDIPVEQDNQLQKALEIIRSTDRPNR